MLLIIVLLLIVLRSPVAAVITFVPAVVALLVSEKFIAGLGAHGLQISSVTQTLLIVLILGAGTDYGLFLVYRFREGLRAGGERPRRDHQRPYPGRRVDHRVGRDGDPRAADPAVRRLRPLPRPRRPARARHRGHAARRAYPAARAARGHRPGDVRSRPADEPPHRGRAGSAASAAGTGPVGPGRGPRRAPPGRRARRRRGRSSRCSRWPPPAYKTASLDRSATAPAGSDAAAGNALLASDFPQSSASPSDLILRYASRSGSTRRTCVSRRGSLRRIRPVLRPGRTARPERHRAATGRLHRAARRARRPPRSCRSPSPRPRPAKIPRQRLQRLPRHRPVRRPPTA